MSALPHEHSAWLVSRVQVWTTDVCVPLSRMADCIVQTKDDISKSHLIAPLVGHVGDGNFHVFFLLDPSNDEDMAEAQRLNARMVRRAIQMEGTCTGEHGVGVGKTVSSSVCSARRRRMRTHAGCTHACTCACTGVRIADGNVVARVGLSARGAG